MSHTVNVPVIDIGTLLRMGVSVLSVNLHYFLVYVDVNALIPTIHTSVMVNVKNVHANHGLAGTEKTLV